jgi:hypothetical protein
MKRRGYIGICFALLVSAFLVTTCSAQSPPTDQPITGIAISGVSEEVAPVWGGPFNGTGTLAINGISMPVAVTSNSLLEDMLLDNFGRIQATTEHVLDFGDGNTIRTSDEVFLTPTQPGWFLVQATMKIVSGTGMFATISGEIGVYGSLQSDGVTGTSLWLMDGRFTV